MSKKDAFLHLSTCSVDLDRGLVHRFGGRTKLTAKELETLRMLVEQAGGVVSRETLLEEVWDYRAGVVSRTLDTTIYTLRQKIEPPDGDPVHLLTVRGKGYRFELATDSPDQHRTNLPPARMPLVGRTEDLEWLRRLVDRDVHLITIRGLGGVGKSRLARAFARLQAARRPGGAWFADLSAARDVPGICHAVATALSVNLAGLEPLETLTQYLADQRSALLVLDNFEQVIEAGPETVGRWLDEAPELTLLVTSREDLRLRGEHVFSLEPLSLPPADPAGPEDLEDSDAVTLFKQGITALQPGFVLESAHVPAVASLVRGLEGLPLSLELAAARCRTLAPDQLLERLHECLDLLHTRNRDVTPRQASLRHTLDWSWGLLGAQAKQDLARCAVFRGGFTLSGAAAVLGGARDLVPRLDDLVDQSLLQVETDGRGRSRYSFFEFVRLYARERLAAGGEALSTREDHADWCLSLAGGHALDVMRSSRGAACLERWAAELENLRAAFYRTCDWDDGRRAAALAEMLVARELIQGSLVRIIPVVDRVLAVPSATAAALALVRVQRASACQLAGRTREAEQELRGALEAVSPARRPLALAQAARILVRMDRLDDAAELLTEAQDLAEHPMDLAQVLTRLGEFHRARSDHGEARRCLEEALKLDEAIGATVMAAANHGELGQLHREDGSLDQARDHLEACLALSRELGNTRLEGLTRLDLAEVCRAQGNDRDAGRHGTAALERFRRLRSPRHEVLAMMALGRVALARGELPTARQWLERAESCLRQGGPGPRQEASDNLDELRDVLRSSRT